MSLNDEVIQLLPTAALTAALYGLWANTFRGHKRDALAAKYSMLSKTDWENPVRTAWRLAWLNAAVPIVVVILMSPLTGRVLGSLDFDSRYSEVCAFFVLIIALWVLAAALAISDLISLSRHRRDQIKRRQEDERRASAAASTTT